MKFNQNGIQINTISGGIVNFGGAFKIAPVSITISTSGSSTAARIPGISTNTGTLQGVVSST